jgi:hypothetical protein
MKSFRVSQTLRMTVPQEPIPIEHYLRQPHRLVQAITDPSRIQQLDHARFRLGLRPLTFMMINIRPTADLRVWTQADGTLYLESLSCDLGGAESLSKSFELSLTGQLAACRLSTATELRGEANLTVQVDVPAALRLMPDALLQSAGDAFLQGILLTIKYRLERQLLQDYRCWVKTHADEPNASLLRSAAGLAS